MGPCLGDLESATEERRELTGEERDLWEQIVEAVTAVIVDVEQFDGDGYLQLDDGVGMQLTMVPGKLSINSPYWFEGDDAEQVVEKLRRVTSVDEGVTGLVAYDPQADAVFLLDGSASPIVVSKVSGPSSPRVGTCHSQSGAAARIGTFDGGHIADSSRLLPGGFCDQQIGHMDLM